MAAERGEAPLAGILLAHKPAGPTSHDVVETTRRVLGERRIGHTGTLDPFAEGLLLLAVGPATRLVEYFHRLDKVYEARLRLGEETTTHDPEGEVIRTSEEWRELDAGRIEEVLGELTGQISQRPPAFSAKRVNGERAHRAAREGREIELEPVEVTVHELLLRDWTPPELELRARVGTGTYVRALARDLGRALGCGAHLHSLARTRIGPFRLDDALDPGVLESRFQEGGRAGMGSAWRRPAEALPWMPTRRLGPEEARVVGHGAAIPAGTVEAPRWEEPGAGTGEPWVALVREGRLLAVAEREDGRLQPRKVFPGAA